MFLWFLSEVLNITIIINNSLLRLLGLKGEKKLDLA